MERLMPPDSYYQNPRTDLLEWAGRSGRHVLEIGCGDGANAPWLRAHGAKWIEGVEPHRESARTAGEKFDQVHMTTIEDALGQFSEPFDLIICADVIEHLVDPETVLARLRERAVPHSSLTDIGPEHPTLPGAAPHRVWCGIPT